MSARAASRSGGAAILWGLFAASSWAWCIGLFLPVVLRRLMGWPGFAAFAIPNVLGCAAFGFVLDRRRSRRLVRDHRGAMALFGAVTIAYQLLLAGWTGRIAIGDSLTPALGDAGAWAGAGVGLLAVFVVGLAVAMARDRAIAWIAAAAWGFSAIALAAAWWIRPPAAGLDAAAFAPELAPTEVWWLLPTLLLGFLLCPYLDLTFHRALRRGPRRPTFAIFGVTFAALIVLVALLADPAAFEATGIGMTLLPILLAQLWVQLGFTSGAHAREIARALQRHRGGPSRARWTIAAAVIAGAMLGTPLLADEANYLRMLGWYGLVFPAYVLVAMVGLRRPPDATAWWLVGGAALVGLPLMEVGISGRTFAWTAGGAAAVLVAALVAVGLRGRPIRVPA
jgi:hypothetical protein